MRQLLGVSVLLARGGIQLDRLGELFVLQRRCRLLLALLGLVEQLRGEAIRAFLSGGVPDGFGLLPGGLGLAPQAFIGHITGIGKRPLRLGVLLVGALVALLFEKFAGLALSPQPVGVEAAGGLRGPRPVALGFDLYGFYLPTRPLRHLLGGRARLGKQVNGLFIRFLGA